MSSERLQYLRKLTRRELVVLVLNHDRYISSYCSPMQWTKDELIDTILDYEEERKT